ncbi:MAG: alpha/beta hydrolase [Tateyamaria sp.]|uniref:alpha/beta hydrolase n=1 Tax=Tateyamaria sp. TaxID=1929288 RepID=UPI00329C7C61
MTLVGPVVVSAQSSASQFDTVSFELDYAAASNAVDRLVLLEDAISKLQSAENPDLRLFAELLSLRVDELEATGRLDEAARAAADLYGFAVSRAGETGIDPLPTIMKAGQLAEAAGNFRLTLRMKEAELDWRRDGGQTGEALAQILDDMARIATAMGNSERAAQLTEDASTVRTAPDDIVENRSDTDGGFHEVEVFYATDRARTGEDDPTEFYGADRGELDYGTLVVTVPDTHVPGAIEAPSVWRLEFAPNPTRHVMLQSVTPLGFDTFFELMRNAVAAREKREAFVFVHGFNVRFDAAAKRAAQLAYDMNYRGVPILYSWPSAGKTMAYVADTAVVRLSGRRLSQFLQDLHDRSGADVIHIVAHSMGNRALTDALELLAARQQGSKEPEPMFGQIFFAAPDVDAGLFSEMTRSIRPLAQRLTLYASEQDWALVTSRKLHGNAPRAGQAGADILEHPHFDTVDMSALGEDMLAHSYFANDGSALADIMALLWRNPAPGQRCGLSPLSDTASLVGGAWTYNKETCDAPNIIGLLSLIGQENEVSVEKIRAVIAEHVTDPQRAAALQKQLVEMMEEP